MVWTWPFAWARLESTNLIARPLIDYTLTMCASPEYVARRGAPQKPEDLRHHDCLSFAYPAGDDWHSVEKEWRLAGPEGEVSVAVSGPMLINSSAGLHQAARTGMGIVMLPDVLVEQDLQDGKLLGLMPELHPAEPADEPDVRPGPLSLAEIATFRRLRRADVGQALAGPPGLGLISLTYRIICYQARVRESSDGRGIEYRALEVQCLGHERRHAAHHHGTGQRRHLGLERQHRLRLPQRPLVRNARLHAALPGQQRIDLGKHHPPRRFPAGHGPVR